MSGDLLSLAVSRESILTGLNFLATTIAIVAGIYTGIVGLARAKREKEQTELVKFRDSMDSEDMYTLGNYLENTLGSIRVSEYTRSQEIRSRVDLYLRRINTFLGQDEDIAKEKEALDVQPKKGKDFPYASQLPLPPDIEKKLSEWIYEANTGEPWNALAKFRRELEQQLLELVRTSDVPVSKLQSAGQLLLLAQQQNLLSNAAAKELKFVVSIANQGIHGFEVPSGTAIDALNRGAEVLRQIRGDVPKY